MRQHPVFHLGFAKCASIFLQKQVFPNLCTYEYVRGHEEPRKILRCFPHELPKVPTLARIAGTRAIVSEEGFLTAQLSPLLLAKHMVDGGVWNIRRLYGDYVTLLIVIRRQDDLVRSRFRFKHGVLIREELYFLDYPAKSRNLWKTWTFQTRGGVYLTSFDYFGRLIPLVDLFGKDRVKILLYEDLVADSDKFFGDLSEALEEDVSFLVSRASQREKESLRRAPPWHPIVQKANQLTGGLVNRVLPKRKIDISEHYAEGLLKIYRDGNRRLSSFFGLDLDKYGYF